MDDLISRQKVLQCIEESRKNIDWGQSEDGDAFLHYSAALYRTIASEECLHSEQPEERTEERTETHACDSISRREAIDYFVTNVGWIDEDGNPVEDSDELRKLWTDLFNGVPSAQPALSGYSDRLWRNAYERGKRDALTGWIPCDEALPTKNGKYLCTNTAWGAYIIDFDMWTDGSWWTPEDEHIAWMPLPEPYRKEDQNG